MPLEDGLRLEQAGFLAMFGHEPVQAAMTAYVAYTERHGTLPARDDDARAQLEGGTFAPFHLETAP